MTSGQKWGAGGSVAVALAVCAYFVFRQPRLRPGMHVVPVGKPVTLRSAIIPFDQGGLTTIWLEPFARGQAIVQTPAPARNLFVHQGPRSRLLQAILLRPGIARVVLMAPGSGSRIAGEWILATPGVDASSLEGTAFIPAAA